MRIAWEGSAILVQITHFASRGIIIDTFVAALQTSTSVTFYGRIPFRKSHAKIAVTVVLQLVTFEAAFEMRRSRR